MSSFDTLDKEPENYPVKVDEILFYGPDSHLPVKYKPFYEHYKKLGYVNELNHDYSLGYRTFPYSGYKNSRGRNGNGNGNGNSSILPSGVSSVIDSIQNLTIEKVKENKSMSTLLLAALVYYFYFKE